jgi:hypothetical protein
MKLASYRFGLLLTLFVVPTFASTVFTDGTWYNFYTLTHNSFATNGSSSTTPFYSQPGDPPWTFTATGVGAILTVVDGGHQGDTFSVYDFGSLIGNTSDTPADPNHTCDIDPNACLADPLMSRGIFNLAAGDHSITIHTLAYPFDPPSTLEWFKVDPAPASTVPEPASMLMLASGLLAVAAWRRRR